MKYSSITKLTLAVAMLGAVSQAGAVNITINDLQGGNGTGVGFNPAGGVGQGGEDQETEIGTVGSQSWDFEAFTLNGSNLKVYGGYNILTGNNPYGVGDIFIDVNGDANWKPGADNSIKGKTDNGVFKYDYVIHFTGRVGTTVTGDYDVYSLASDKSVSLFETKYKAGSNPWILDLDGSQGAKKISSGNLTLTADTNWKIDADGTTLTGGSAKAPHWVTSPIPLDFLAPGELKSGTLFKLTQECGNDSLVGRVADGGTTLALMGAAMSGMAFFVRRNRKA